MVKKTVAAVLTQRVNESRSPLYRWLAENYDQIEPIIRDQPAWEALARTVGDSSNLPRPSRQGVRKAWLKLMQDKERSLLSPPAQRRLSTPAAQAVVPVPVIQTEQSGHQIKPDIPRAAPRRNFAVSVPKKET